MVYVPHLPAADMLSADAIAGVADSFEEVSRDLHAQASDQRRGHEVGSSSQATHRVVGSVAVSLARHADVPIVIVP